MIRRVFVGVDPNPDDEVALALAQRVLAHLEHVVDDVFIRMIDHARAKALGLRWLCFETSAIRDPMVCHESTVALFAELSGAPACGITVDELKRISGFVGWLDGHMYALASCGALVSGDIEELTIDYAQRGVGLDALAALENLPRPRRTRGDQQILDAAADAGTLGLRQWFADADPAGITAAWQERSVYEVVRSRRRVDPTPVDLAPATPVDLHAMRPDYHALAVPWDRSSWGSAARP